MKFVISLLFILPIAATGQSVADYIHAMEKFRKFYNAGRGDNINALFKRVGERPKNLAPIWTNRNVADELHKSGTLKSFKFIGIDTADPQKVYVFQTVFSKAGTKTTSLTLDKDHNFLTFRFFPIPEVTPVLPNKDK